MAPKTLQEAKANFEASIAYIPDRYKNGVMKADWLGPAKSDQAEKNFAAAMTTAIAKKSRQIGVSNVSNEDWRNAAANKGAPIIGERIRGALGDWEAAFGPMYAAVQSRVATLPPKTTDWRGNINSRLVPTVEAWKRAAGKT